MNRFFHWNQMPEAPAPGKRSPAQVVESLNSLSIDIARAIDHEASVELWDRYKRGERNVFTRRLYTIQGQQTFDEIRRKYQAETEFRRLGATSLLRRLERPLGAGWEPDSPGEPGETVGGARGAGAATSSRRSASST